MQQNLVLAPIEKLLPIRNNPFGQQKARSNAGFRRKCTIFQRGIPQKGISSSSKLSAGICGAGALRGAGADCGPRAG
ncbi:hypothetical protein, partial [Rudaea sp. 3F27F6]|uniref:hypothetical protein n=1 Tax=Rudaea sp. 3F27F6 TaxID=2502208 RepID=UPI001BB23987